MTNPEWGIKRICQSCGTKFYDLLHDPIRCPKCQTEYDPEAFLKTRRSRPATVAEKQPVAADKIADDADIGVEDVEGVEAVEDDEDIADLEEAGDDEEEDVLEDASELGEDEDDMAEVIENVDEDDER